MDSVGKVAQGAVGDFMDDGKLNGSSGNVAGTVAGAVGDAVGGAFGGLDLSQYGDVGNALLKNLGGDNLVKLAGILKVLNINPIDLISKIPLDKIGDLAGVLKGNDTSAVTDLIGSLVTGGSSEEAVQKTEEVATQAGGIGDVIGSLLGNKTKDNSSNTPDIGGMIGSILGGGKGK